MLADEDLRERIHASNIAVHKFEAQYYELLHPEVYGREEQNRILSTLKTIDKLVEGKDKKALDCGAGTGNLTGKLLGLGYRVTAIDISKEMCDILKKKYLAHLRAGNLTLINSSVEDAGFDNEEFDVITCYSVLHHLPDYLVTLHNLCFSLRKGGVMYLDHEASPFYWQGESGSVAGLVKLLYFHSNPILNAVYFQLAGVPVPSVDYTFSDYWHKKEHPLDHSAIEGVFEKENFKFFERTDYHSKATWIPNPIFYAYRYFCKPEMSSWISKK